AGGTALVLSQPAGADCTRTPVSHPDSDVGQPLDTVIADVASSYELDRAATGWLIVTENTCGD
ncbi:MAG: hypothetical protein ACSLEW_12415, partial [Nocardioides sp.]